MEPHKRARCPGKAETCRPVLQRRVQCDAWCVTARITIDVETDSCRYMLLLFDYDGVIADTFQLFLDIFNAAQRSLGEGRALTKADLSSLPVNSLTCTAEVIGIPDHLIPRFEAEAAERLVDRASEVHLFTEIPSMLRALSHKHTLCIVTLNKFQYVATTLTAYSVMDTIARIYGYETGLSKTESIVLACSTFGSNAETTYFIGDGISDLQAARQAGVKTVAALWGFQDREMLLGEAPDFLADRPDDLLNLFT